jgi:hypothetical protein
MISNSTVGGPLNHDTSDFSDDPYQVTRKKQLSPQIHVQPTKKETTQGIDVTKIPNKDQSSLILTPNTAVDKNNLLSPKFNMNKAILGGQGTSQLRTETYPPYMQPRQVEVPKIHIKSSSSHQPSKNQIDSRIPVVTIESKPQTAGYIKTRNLT